MFVQYLDTRDWSTKSTICHALSCCGALNKPGATGTVAALSGHQTRGWIDSEHINQWGAAKAGEM